MEITPLDVSLKLSENSSVGKKCEGNEAQVDEKI